VGCHVWSSPRGHKSVVAVVTPVDAGVSWPWKPPDVPPTVTYTHSD
jgi:hypothetical protein